MGIFEDNIAAIEKKYGLLAEKIREIDIEKASERIGLAQAANGMLIPWVKHQGRAWRLNSMQNPMEAAELYAGRYQIRLYGIYFVFGFSDGRCVRELWKKCDDTNLIVVCEPELELFAMVCHEFEICDLIEAGNVLFYLAELETEAQMVLQKIVDYTHMKLLEFCILPGYDILYHDTCETFMDSIIERMRNEVVNKATSVVFDRLIPQYTLFHMKNLLYHKNLEQLRQALAEHRINEIPVIIVAAGPSLDKNIDALKKAQGKAFIMVVDAALRTVLKTGIKPDMVCTVDPNSPDRFFDGVDLNGIIWACTRTSRKKVVEQYGEDIFYYGSYYRGWNETLENEMGYAIPSFASGGSVSAEAFMIALYLGFRKLVFIGQDLAFTGGQSHTKEVIGTFGDNKEYIQRRKIVEVEGIDGTILETDFQMWYYKQWFEKVIHINGNLIEVIDATEGGAKIEGTVNQTLAETIEQQCKREIDIYGIEKSIPAAFSAEKQQELLKKLRGLKQEAADFRVEITEMIGKQEELLLVAKDTSTPERELLEKLKDMLIQNEKISRKEILDLIAMYAHKEEYEMGDDIYTEENMSPVELVEKSLLLYKGYEKGAKQLEEDIDEFIMKD